MSNKSSDPIIPDGLTKEEIKILEEKNIIMTKTRQKLEEAKYFFSQMECGHQENNNTKLQHNLNAFLNSSRNVTFVMKKEFSKYCSFKDWYEKAKVEKFKDKKMAKFKDLRNVSVKERSIVPMYVNEVRFEKGLTVGPGTTFQTKRNGK